MNKTMTEMSACVTICTTHQAAEQALGKLQSAGIDLQQVSIVGKGYHDHDAEHPIGFYTAGDGISYWGLQGAFWGGLWGVLTGAAFLLLPGFGPLAAAGPIVGLLVSGLEGVAIGGGVGVLAATLFDMGIPRGSILDYEQAIRAGRLLLMVHGGQDLVERASKVLHGETQQVTVHHA